MNGHIVITPSIAEILERCTVDGFKLFLPPGQLDRKTYEAVNKVLEALGGDWTRKVRAHVFAYPPDEALDMALSTGYAVDQRKALNFFETPLPLAAQVVEIAAIRPEDSVLEPSCGHGALVAEALKYVSTIDVCDINESALERTLKRFGCLKVRPVGKDFLTFDPHARYDRIIANPPFGRQQDLAHLSHMLDLLKPSGRLVTIMSAGFVYRTDRKTTVLKAKLSDTCAEWGSDELPDGAFKSSGTMVKAIMLHASAREEGELP